jgi:squalene cyclase
MTPGALVTRALDHGVGFLLANQSADGLWRDFDTPAGEASYWPTGFVAAALHAAGVGHEFLYRTAETLVASQNADGGWGYNDRVPTDADSTAWVVIFLTRMGSHETSCRRAAACLLTHQRARNGGVATYATPGPIRRFMGIGRWMPFWGWCRPHSEVTAAAGSALAGFEPGRWVLSIESALRFVCAQQNAAGSWSSYWWTSAHFTTAQAVEFATICHRRDVITRAAEWALRTQGDDGGWAAGGDCSAFATAMALSILVSAGAAGPLIERAVKRLIALQLADGGWPCGPIMRIPVPAQMYPEEDRRWQPVRFSGGVDVTDQHGLFTSAACVAALGRAAAATCTPSRLARHDERS